MQLSFLALTIFTLHTSAFPTKSNGLEKRGIESAFKKFGKSIADTGKKAVKGAEKVGNQIAKGGEKVGNQIAKGAEKEGKNAGKELKKVAGKVKDGGAVIASPEAVAIETEVGTTALSVAPLAL